MEQILITPNEFKTRYTTALPTQYNWRKSKKVPFEKIGENILYNQAICDELAFDGKLGREPLLAIMRIKQSKDAS